MMKGTLLTSTVHSEKQLQVNCPLARPVRRKFFRGVRSALEKISLRDLRALLVHVLLKGCRGNLSFARKVSPVFLLFLLIAASYSNIAFADSFSGQVVGVSDGDTITIMHNGQAEKIRLWGIDCPEKAQAFGQKAKQKTSELAFGKVVTVIKVDTDRYGRTVGEVILSDRRNLNHELVGSGMCWWYRK